MVIGSTLVLLLALGTAQTAGTDQDANQEGWEVTPQLVDAVNKGLAYLASTQNADGSWNGDIGYKLNQNYQVLTSQVAHVGVTALAGIAFLAGGNLPGRGPYGDGLNRAIDYITSHVNALGFITDNGSRMYDHAFATLFLAEAYGMTHRADVRDKLQAAVDLIVKCQNKEGSWRYEPFAVESDMSITVCQLMALRSARNIGIKVPASTINAAVKYVKDSQVMQDQPHYFGPHYYRLERGSFKYQNEPNTRSSFALTAAGVTSLYHAGAYGTREIKPALEYLRRNIDIVSQTYATHYFYYYGHYYAVQAMYMAGEPYWSWYFNRMRTELLNAQSRDGSWENDVGPGRNFGTAVAALILEIPYHYLPIFQR